MKKAVIYGCGNTGKIAYEYLKDKFDILFFVDKNANKIGNAMEQKIPVYEPEELKKCGGEVKIIIASLWYKEILENIKRLGIKDSDIEVFRINLENVLPYEIEEAMDRRTIDLGDFLLRGSNIRCKELTFLVGGSSVLDYVFLKQIALLYECKEYLEVGTYIGESINILTECCRRLYSVTAPLEGSYSAKGWCEAFKLPNHSEKLTYSDKIIHYYGDSKEYDFSEHADTVDLYYIDGDHSYQGVYCDTKNIFTYKKEDAIVVWHDFKMAVNQYNTEVIRAVKDALGSEFENVYAVDNNMCGIYIPKCRKFDFKLHRRCYEENAPLYTYDVELKNGKIYKSQQDTREKC